MPKQKRVNFLLIVVVIFVFLSLGVSYFFQFREYLGIFRALFSFIRTNSFELNGVTFTPGEEGKIADLFFKEKNKLPLKPESVTLIAVGDISFSRGVEKAVKKAGDPSYPFKKVKDSLLEGDIVFGNLETPITPGREIEHGEMIFRSSPETAKVLKEAGFSILSLANNHTPNFGEKGLLDTFSFLEKAGIQFVGAGKNLDEAERAVILERKGLKFAFLAYSEPSLVPASYEASALRAGTNFMNIERMQKAVAEAKKRADFVIVSMHTGAEYQFSANETQKQFARAAIDAGADLVLGHHPHVVENLEKYKGRYIFYSLGNFIFDQMWSLPTRESFILKIWFEKDGLRRITFTPVMIENYSQPRLATSEESKRILERLQVKFDEQKLLYFEAGFKEKTLPALYDAGKEEGDFRVNKEIEMDLDGDREEEKILLKDGALSVIVKNKPILGYFGDFYVKDFLIGDINGDGFLDLNFIYWQTPKRKEEIEKNSQESYFGSLSFAIPLPDMIAEQSFGQEMVLGYALRDVDLDKKLELITLSKDLEKPEKSYLRVWQWENRKMIKEYENLVPGYSKLELKEEGERVVLVLDRS